MKVVSDTISVWNANIDGRQLSCNCTGISFNGMYFCFFDVPDIIQTVALISSNKLGAEQEQLCLLKRQQYLLHQRFVGSELHVKGFWCLLLHGLLIDIGH